MYILLKFSTPINPLYSIEKQKYWSHFGKNGKLLPDFRKNGNIGRISERAARLASLASRIAARLAYLRNQPQRAESYYRSSLTFARISQDPDVHVAAIKRLASHIIEDERRAQEAYDIYQQALPILSNSDNVVDPRLQGLIYV